MQTFTMPFLLLAILIAGTVVVRLALLQPAEPPTAAGAAVMGVGIFALGALQETPFGPGLLTQLIALELLVVWAYIASGLVASGFKGTFGRHVSDIVGCFAIGTWVAGTFVLARLVNNSMPEWRPLALALGIIGLLVFVAYLPLALVRFWRIAADPRGLGVTGRILLATVSVQSVVVAADVLVPGGLPGWLATGLIVFGYLLYLFGFVLILRRYVRLQGWRLSVDWDNTNCILHGAVSITGLAAVLSRTIPDEPWVVSTWIWAAGMFVIVEGIELARMWVRVEAFGLRKGIFTYNVSQWARNFTFGMFYLFTLRMYTQRQAGGLSDLPLLTGVQAVVISWGQYVVLFFLVAEVALFLGENIYNRLRARKTGGQRLGARG